MSRHIAACHCSFRNFVYFLSLTFFYITLDTLFFVHNVLFFFYTPFYAFAFTIKTSICLILKLKEANHYEVTLILGTKT